MPTACKTLCNEPGCNALVAKGRCTLHAKQHARYADTCHRTYEQNEHRKELRRSQWTRLRPCKLSRNPLCEACSRPAECVDHITSTADGGAMYDPDNLQSLCWSCHSKKTVAFDGGYGRKT